jgi:hypothetical protein
VLGGNMAGSCHTPMCPTFGRDFGLTPRHRNNSLTGRMFQHPG